MSVTHGVVATMRSGVLVAIAAAMLAPALLHAQAAETRPREQKTPEVQAAERVRHDMLLEKLDSLRWEFEHQRMTDQEREEIRREMMRAFRDLDESMTRLRRSQLDIAREASRAARVWSTSPDVRVMLRTSRPTGYLGLSFDGPNTEDTRDNQHFIRFYQYPMIALVEPSSPADRAGIRKGDTLLALNGTDVVKTEISLSRMLIPDEKITVRVRRGGDTRNLAVVVGLAPEYVVRRWTPSAVAIAPVPAPMARVTEAPPVAAAPAAPAAPVAASTGFVWTINEGIGGAKLETVTEGLGRALGVRSGVLVVRATTGTPAHESGLRDGDVIIRASGKAVTSIRDLRNAVAWGESEEGVKLVIVRERKQRDVTLHW